MLLYIQIGRCYYTNFSFCIIVVVFLQYFPIVKNFKEVAAMMQLVGKERLDYVSKKTNRMVRGYNLHFVENSPKCEGLKTSTAFVNDEVYDNYFNIPLDSYVEVYYNSFRQVCGCKVYE